MLRDYLTENINNCKAKIAGALSRANRNDDVLLVGASKMNGQEVIDVIDKYRLLTALGENRVQELLDKYRENQSFNWHFIGVLQSNKVKYIIDKVTLIESVDRFSLAQEINKQAEKHNLVMDILLQINMGKEENKSGYYLEDIERAIEEIKILKNVKSVGLMAVMPIADDNELIRLYKQLGAFYNSIKDKYGFKYLSCGMSNDFELAIEYAGANIVRIGREIFGERRY